MILLGAAPMAIAQANSNADPILAESMADSPLTRTYPAPGFTLTDQSGRTITLESLRGKVVLLGFLDSACPADCPIVQEFRQAAQLLGASAHQVQLVGIVLGRFYRPIGALQASDRRTGLTLEPDWLYLSGTLNQLQQVWRAYGIAAQDRAGTATLRAYVIDPVGNVRQEYSIEPGVGTAAIKSSFAVLFADGAQQAMSARGEVASATAAPTSRP